MTAYRIECNCEYAELPTGYIREAPGGRTVHSGG